MAQDRLTYFQIQGYPGDITKYCSLNGIEIDNNFFTLEGRDVKSVHAEGDILIITLYNGQQLTCSISSIVTDITVGQGIDGDLFSADKIIATNAGLIETTEELTVTGEGIGSYNPGDVIPVGTSVEEILRKLLVKIFNPTAVLPTSTLTVKVNGANLAQTYEVGTDLGNCVLSVNYHDGRFVGNDSWTYDHAAQCAALQTRYYYDGSIIGGTFVPGTGNKTYNPGTLTEGTHYFSAYTSYGDSQFQPTCSDGSASSVNIPAGNTEESRKNFNVAFKYYYGYVEGRPLADYNGIIPNAAALRSMGLGTGFCTVNGTTNIPYMESSASKSALVLALPQKYHNITRTENSFYAPVTISEKWKSAGVITDYSVGGSQISYYVYVLHSMLPIRYNNIEFGLV